ncbi:hypothetical protein SCP_0201070 [Sparassis crispa]|uniref:Uncharacterized protein n=1 Tax=Sparassis crispa TaxID=139825 RepID=A0A401G9R4_9APHY|nr:hypothetical protein SCP_0201070 [Sparassis crispa]GBE78910.1 hypothetical protein SCP_0201070 [Sparassis crispa]
MCIFFCRWASHSATNTLLFTETVLVFHARLPIKSLTWMFSGRSDFLEDLQCRTILSAWCVWSPMCQHQ